MKRRDLRILDGARRHPFGLGPLVESLQAAGVPTDAAMRIALDVEKHYRQRGDKGVSLDELMARLGRFAGAESGPEAAEALARQTPPFVDLEVVGTDGRRDRF